MEQCVLEFRSVFMVFVISVFAGCSFGSVEYCFMMSARRNLPAWMVASDPKSGKEEQIRESLKRKPEVKTSKRIPRKCTKRMIYWMNEQELVETALRVIKRVNEETAAGDRCARLSTEMTVIPETDHEESTDSEVSEPAVDMSKRECLEERQRSSAPESNGERRLASSHALEKDAESKEDNSQTDCDQEALQVLREIFFS